MASSKPKFEIGQVVDVTLESTDVSWRGTVVKRNDTGEEEGESMWEYAVSNAPLLFNIIPPLAWEHEMTLVKHEKVRNY